MLDDISIKIMAGIKFDKEMEDSVGNFSPTKWYTLRDLLK